jgi:uncharacterized protein YcnI
MKSFATRWAVAGLASIAMSVASAHVTVWPRESRTGAYEKYVLRVPTEGKVATTSVEIEIPAGATFVSIGAPLGHTYELKKSGERVVGIVWSMQIKPGEFAEFAFMARNPKDGAELVWKAIQRFADGTSTQWSGPAGDKHPASVTKLSAGDGGHSH